MNLIRPKQRKEWLDRAEDYADTFFQRTKYVLPHVARFCLLSTFLEDGLRMWMQWGDQRNYIMHARNVGWVIGTVFVIINLFGQLVPCGMILARKRTDIACGILVFDIFFQSIAYRTIREPRFLLRSCALVGGLILLMVENRKEGRSLFAGVPTMQNNTPKNYMQLAGRMLLVIMFLTIVHYELSFTSILKHLIGGICMLFVAVGFKTKLSALFLVAYLTFVNFYSNCFWTVSNHRALHDFLKYDFFQTMSVIGGLLFVVALGPGEVSLDARKKEW